MAATSSGMTSEYTACINPKSQIPGSNSQLLGFGIWTLGFGISPCIGMTRRFVQWSAGHNSGMHPRFLCLLVAGTLMAPAVIAQQTEQPPLTFRVEANFVEVDAFVSDAAGKPITDLRAGDFQLLEDAKPQMVSAFSYVNIPIARVDRPLFSPTAIEPDVDTNVGMNGRVYLFVLDDLHVDLTR